MNNNKIKQEYDKEKIRKIIKMSARVLKEKENHGKTNAQTITELVNGIERILKDDTK
jgi:hypothetical protein